MEFVYRTTLVAVLKDSLARPALSQWLESVRRTSARMEGRVQLWEWPLSAHAQKDTLVCYAKNQVTLSATFKMQLI